MAEPTLFDVAPTVNELDRPEEFRPITDFLGYAASSHGHIYTESGSDTCDNCGNPLPPGPRKLYCSKVCRQRASYENLLGTHVSRATPRRSRLSPTPGDQGHLRVTMYRDGRRERLSIHRIILLIFKGPPPEEGLQGCHWDGDPSHNWPSNLRWGTQEDNWEDRKRHGNARAWSKASEEQVSQIRRLHLDGASEVDIGEEFGISDTQVSNIVNEKQWKVE